MIKFSIIMCINDNSEICNIEKTINSIIRQSVGFEKNIELILMDTCKNKKITSFLTHYDKIYPNNIILKKVKHSNLTQIRKIGIKLASNEIISFINVGDELAIDTLKKIQKFGKKQDKNLNIIVIPLYEYTNGDMIKKYNQFAKNSKIIELNNENNKFLLFNCGTFYRKNLFANVDFTTKNFNGENWYFNWQLLKSNKKIGFVTDHNVSYILNNSNIIAIDESINVLSRIDFSKIDVIEKKNLFYVIRQLVNNINVNNQQKTEILTNISTNISADIIIEQNKFIDTNLIIAMLKLKGEDLKKLTDNDEIQMPYNINIRNTTLENNKLNVEVLFNNYGCDNLELVLIDGNQKIYKANTSKDLNTNFDISVGDLIIDKTHYREFCLDLRKSKIYNFSILNNTNNKLILVENVKVYKSLNFCLKDSEIGTRYKNVKINIFKNKIRIRKYLKSGFYFNITSFLKILRRKHYVALFRLFNRRDKKYILINDRPFIAQDNGEALFKYINKNEKELAKVTYFVIDKKSCDYKRLKKIGKVVKIRSLKHKFLFLNSKLIYSSHNHKLFYYAFKSKNYKYYADQLNYKFVWLQHGITMNNISKSANKLKTNNDYITIATMNEYNEFKKDYYFLNDNNILKTGFARFDNLINCPKNVISFCPTWRHELSDKILESGIHQTKPNFEETNYYKNIAKFLESKKLIKLLKDNNLKLNLVLHPGALGYKHYFDKLEYIYIYI